MNHSDSERFTRVVEEIGLEPTAKWQEADLIVFNTCSVRQKAEDRVIGMGPQIMELKARNPDLRVVLTGCMARRSWQGVSRTGSPIQMTKAAREVELKSTLPWVDVVLEAKDFPTLPARLGYQLDNQEQPSDYLSYQPKYSNSFQAFVPISTGCDHFCTYCIVPFARGGEICRPSLAIINEVRDLILSGVKDITLLGQTVNRYINPDFDQVIKQGQIANTQIPTLNRYPLSPESLAPWQAVLADQSIARIDLERVKQYGLIPPRDFLQLLQIIDQIPGQWWLNWVSSHPNYLTDALLEFVSASVRTASTSQWRAAHSRPYLHFALQSGSDPILKRMNRRYTVEQFLARTSRIRELIPDISLSTDIIVGFPGETTADLEATATAMQAASFEMAYLSEFSPRQGTAAALIRDDVPRSTKSQWKTYLNDEVLSPIALNANRAQIGTYQLVLVERFGRGSLHGRTATGKQVRLASSDQSLVGKFVEVEVTSSANWSLSGKIRSI